MAGSDPGAGAGLQVDLKVLNAFGVHGCSVVTALTAQNTVSVQAVESVSESMLRSQIKALDEDLPAVVIKTGMLGSSAACRLLAAYLDEHPVPRPRLVCDPVLKSTSGSLLLDHDALELLRTHIFPHAAVLTPNLPEAETLTGITHPAEKMAERLLETGAASVLIKGGHAAEETCRDYWTDGHQSFWLESPRIDTRHTHGTGCILASAIAAGIAKGDALKDAVINGKTYLNQCLRSPAGVGQGHGPMCIEPFRNDPQDRPNIVHK